MRRKNRDRFSFLSKFSASTGKQRPKRKRKRHPRIESLEQRRLLAAQIESVTIDPVLDTVTFGGDASPDLVGSATTRVYSDQRIPVDPERDYSIQFTAKDDGQLTHVGGYKSYDIDGNLIRSQDSQKFGNATDTFLVEPLHNGDTTIVVEDASGWATSAEHQYYHVLAWYDYADSTGRVYAPHTYTRNSAYSAHVKLWTNITTDANGNSVLHLAEPWSGPDLPASMAVRNTYLGGIGRAFSGILQDQITDQWSTHNFELSPPSGTAHIQISVSANIGVSETHTLSLKDFTIDYADGYRPGDLVTLHANIEPAEATGDFTYQWQQTAGPDMPLSDLNGSDLTFVASDLLDSYDTEFTVSVTDGATSYSPSTSVHVEDPNPVTNVTVRSVLDTVTFGGDASPDLVGSATTRVYSDQRIPVDPERDYSIQFTAKDDGQLTHVGGYKSYDIDGNLIRSQDSQKFGNATDTFLVEPLHNGDTTIVVEDASGWATSAEHQYYHVLAWYDYADSTGRVYAPHTYTRNSAYSAHVKLWTNITTDANGNSVLHLAEPWSGPDLPASMAVRNTYLGGIGRAFSGILQDQITDQWSTHNFELSPPSGTAHIQISVSANIGVSETHTLSLKDFTIDYADGYRPGDLVTLHANIEPAEATGDFTYQWQQTAGPDMPLSDLNGSDLTFVASDLLDSYDTEFTVSVTDGATSYSPSTSVHVEDPNPVTNVTVRSVLDTVTFGGDASPDLVGSATTRVYSDQRIPVDPERDYSIQFTAKDDGQLTHVGGYKSYDIDGNLIRSQDSQKFGNATDTFLVEPLHNGDTTIVVEDASGWATSAEHQYYHVLAWYDYADSTGRVYAPHTYTRNSAYSAHVKLWTNITTDANGNSVLHLAEPWSGPDLPASMAVRNTYLGGIGRAFSGILQDQITDQWSTHNFELSPPSGTAHIQISVSANIGVSETHTLSLKDFTIDYADGYRPGDLVTLHANIEPAEATGDFTYQWQQTAGPDMPLSDLNGSDLTFVASDLLDSYDTEFTVSVTDGATSYSPSTSVHVEDPNPVTNVTVRSVLDTVTFGGDASPDLVGSATTRVYSDQRIPVDPERDYSIQFTAKDDGQLTHVGGYKSYDIDGNLIRSQDSQKFGNATDTFLVEPLHNGDTTIVVEDASGWATSAEHQYYHVLAWYDYADSTGRVYAPHTYTRNSAYSAHVKLWTNITTDANGNSVLHLAEPWSGPDLPASMAVRNTYLGGIGRAFSGILQDQITDQWSTHNFELSPPSGTAHIQISVSANIGVSETHTLSLKDFTIDYADGYRPGDLVTLHANIEPAEATGDFTYQWQQTAGPGVNLSDPNGSDTTFIAPTLFEDYDVPFSVNVSDTVETITKSETIHVVDPYAPTEDATLEIAGTKVVGSEIIVDYSVAVGAASVFNLSVSSLDSDGLKTELQSWPISDPALRVPGNHQVSLPIEFVLANVDQTLMVGANVANPFAAINNVPDQILGSGIGSDANGRLFILGSDGPDYVTVTSDRSQLQMGVLPTRLLVTTHRPDINADGHVTDSDRDMLVHYLDSASTNPWHNALIPWDVNDDGIVSEQDATLVSNAIQSLGSGPLAGRVSPSVPYLDVNGDGTLSSLDVLQVLNRLHQEPERPYHHLENPRDVNGDNVVNSVDLEVLNSYFLNVPLVDPVPGLLVLAGAGDDRIELANFSSNGPLYVYGGEGNDRIIAGSGKDSLFGGPGDDVISGGGGNDLISSGPGDDLVSGDSGADLISTGSGDDQLFGNDPNDLPSLNGSETAPGADWLNVQSGDLNGDAILDFVGTLADGTVVASVSSIGEPRFLSWNLPQSTIRLVDTNGDQSDELFAYDPASGNWTLSAVVASQLLPISQGQILSLPTADELHGGDFNGDGSEEISYTNHVSGLMDFLRFQGAHSSTVFGTVSSHAWAWKVAADVNLDGKTDLVGKNYAGSWIVGLSNGTELTLQTWNHYFPDTLTVDSTPESFTAPLQYALDQLEFVREEISLTPSEKIWKHPAQTLEGGQGNAWDQAYLLLDRLNAASLETAPRFVSGRVEFDSDDFSSLGVENREAAKEVLRVAGLNPVIHSDAINGDSLEFDHAVVQAWLPGPDGLDWQTLDPSFVSTTVTASVPPALPVATDRWLTSHTGEEQHWEMDFSPYAINRYHDTYLGPHLSPSSELALTDGKLITQGSDKTGFTQILNTKSQFGKISADVWLPYINDSVALVAHDGNDLPLLATLHRYSDQYVRMQIYHAGSVYTHSITTTLLDNFDENIRLGLEVKKDFIRATVAQTNNGNSVVLIPEPGNITISNDSIGQLGVFDFQPSGIDRLQDITQGIGNWGLSLSGDTEVSNVQLDWIPYETGSPYEQFIDSVVDLNAASDGTPQSPSDWFSAPVYSGTSYGDRFASVTMVGEPTVSATEILETEFLHQSVTVKSVDSRQYWFSNHYRVADLAENPVTYHFDVQESTPEEPDGVPLDILPNAQILIDGNAVSSAQIPSDTVFGVSIYVEGDSTYLHGDVFHPRTTFTANQIVRIGVLAGQSSDTVVRENWEQLNDLNRQFIDSDHCNDSRSVLEEYYDSFEVGGSHEGETPDPIHVAAILGTCSVEAPEPDPAPELSMAEKEYIYVSHLLDTVIHDYERSFLERTANLAALGNAVPVRAVPEIVVASADDVSYGLHRTELGTDGSLEIDNIPLVPLYCAPGHLSLTGFDLGFAAVPTDGSSVDMTTGVGYQLGQTFAYESAWLQEEVVSRFGTGQALGAVERIAQVAGTGTLLEWSSSTSATGRNGYSIYDPETDSWRLLFTAELDPLLRHTSLPDRFEGRSGGYRALVPAAIQGYSSEHLAHVVLSQKTDDPDRYSFENYVVAGGNILGGAVQPEIQTLTITPPAVSDPDYDAKQAQYEAALEIYGFDNTPSHIGDRTGGGHTNLASGETAPYEVDISLPNIGLPLDFARRHALDDEHETGFGVGWTHTFADDLIVDTNRVTWRTGQGIQHTFYNNHTGNFDAPAELTGWTLSILPSVGYKITSDTGNTWTFASEMTANGLQYLLIEQSDPFGNQILLNRDSNGLLETVATQGPQSAIQTRLRFHWETIQVTGKVNDSQWETANRIVSIEDDAGRTWDYQYNFQYIDHNTRQTLTSVTEPGTLDEPRQQTAYTYDRPGGYRIGAIERREVVPSGDSFVATETPSQLTRFIYYADGRLFQTIDPTGGKTTLLINPWMGRRTEIDANDNYTRFALDSIGQTHRIETARGNHSRQIWDPIQQTLTKSIDAAGFTTSYLYGANNKIAQTTDAKGMVEQYEYDPQWQTLTAYRRAVGTPLQQVTTFTIDPNNGNVLSATDPLQQQTVYTYTAGGLLESVTTPRGTETAIAGDYQTTFSYDTNGQLTQRVQPDPDGSGPLTNPVWNYVYATVGAAALQSVTDPLQHTTHYQNDILGRVTRQIQPDPDGDGPLGALETEYRYDFRGNLVAMIDPRGVGARYQYDLSNRPIAIHDDHGVGATWTYDGVGNPITTSNGIGVWQTGYDSENLPVTSIDPLGRISRTKFDYAGRVTQQIDPRGDATEYEYDPLGQLLQTTYPATDYYDLYTYDLLGRVESRQQKRAPGLGPKLEHYFYDDLDRLVEVHDVEFSATAYAYDADGNLTQQTDFVLHSLAGLDRTIPVASMLDQLSDTDRRDTVWNYDQLGRPTEKVLGDGHSIGYQYDGLGQMIAETDQRGNVTTYDYDPIGWLRTVTQPDPDGPNQPLAAPVWQYDWDASGNVVAVTDPLGNLQQSLYDGTNRLVAEIDTDGTENSYHYDRAGQRVTRVAAGSEVTAYRFDVAGQWVSERMPDPDGQGPLVSPSIRYIYDDAGNVQSTVDPLGRVDDYTYDALGRMTEWLQPAPAEGSSRPRHQWVYDETIYNGFGSLVTSEAYTSPEGIQQKTYFDSVGRVRLYAPQGDQAGTFISYYYDSLDDLTYIEQTGNAYSLTDQSGSSSGQSIRSVLYQYDSVGRVDSAEITDIDGTLFTLDYSYDAAGNLLESTDYQGTVTRSVYDNLNRPIQVDAAFGQPQVATTRYTYDAAGRTTEMVDPVGMRTTYGYDRRDRLVSQTDDAGGSLERTSNGAFDPMDNLTHVRNSQGVITAWQYDALDRVISEVSDVDGTQPETWSWNYDDAGNVRSQVDPRGFQTGYTYDALDRLTTQTDAMGTYLELETLFGYDLDGRLTDVTAPDQVVTHYTYGSANRVDSITEDYQGPDQRVTRFGYSPLGDTMGVLLPRGENGVEDRQQYDIFGRLQSQTRAVGTASETTQQIDYDDAARQWTMTDAEGHVSKLQLDPLGRQVQHTGPDPDGTGPELASQTNYTYNARGDLLTVSERLNGSQSATTQLAIDALGRVTTMTDPLNGVTEFSYDSEDRILQVQDALGQTTQSTYDSLGRLTSEKDPAGRQVDYFYDAAGNLIREESPTRIAQYTLDALGRLQQESYQQVGTSNIDTVNYAFNTQTGRLDAVGQHPMVEKFIFDNLGRIQSQITLDNSGVHPNVVQSYEYFDTDEISKRTENVGNFLKRTVQYTIDDLGRTDSIVQHSIDGESNFAATFDYNQLDQWTNIRRYADTEMSQLAVSTEYQYDQANRLIDLQHSDGSGQSLSGYTYGRDAAGRILSIDSVVDGLSTFTYDLTDQLLGATHADGTSESYQYDAVGNRTGSGYSYGAGNRLLSDGQYAYQYDADGRRIERRDLATGEKLEYGYDPTGRSSSITARSSSGVLQESHQYQYDALGRRNHVYEDSDGNGAIDSSTHFYHEGLHVAGSQTTGVGAGEKSYLHGTALDQVLAEWSDTGSGTDAMYTLTDHLGSVRDLATFNPNNATTHIAGHRVYDSFGVEGSSTGSSAAKDHLFGFTGRQSQGPADHWYLRNRDYDAGSGTFTSLDPLGFAAGDINTYRYVGNDPLNFIDPLGLAEGDPDTGQDVEIRKPFANPEDRYAVGHVCSTPSELQKGSPFAGGAIIRGKTIKDIPNASYVDKVWLSFRSMVASGLTGRSIESVVDRNITDYLDGEQRRKDGRLQEAVLPEWLADAQKGGLGTAKKIKEAVETLVKKGMSRKAATKLVNDTAKKQTAPRRITQVKWGAKIDYNSGTHRAIDHIKDGHFFNSRPGFRSSRFSASNSTTSRVKSLIDDAIAKGKHSTNNRGDYSVLHTCDEIIGTDINGRKTKTIQVFLDELGNVLNAYPVPRPR